VSPDPELLPDGTAADGSTGDGAPSDDAAGDDLVRALPDTLASKIAAGEVVQRPASALKEMMENALDAGASQIDVVLRRAGSDLIQVTDDGCGMGPRDAVAAFGRHATSKLRAFEDLERLRTLGFRGEALASIASVARVELKTKRRQDATAMCVRVDGGDLVSADPCAAPDGTCLSVRTLFYNVPARRAFLKSPATEFKHLVETFQALALSHPGVGFSLVHDDTDVYRLPPADRLAVRLGDLLGQDLSERLVEVAEATTYLSVRGVVGDPAAARRSRGDQYLFVNNRYVKSRALDHAVATAFGALLPDGHHALSALFLDVDPRHVDVNVHPTKTEVLFDDDRGVYSFVRAVVKKGLAESGLGLSFDGAMPVDAPTVPSAGGAEPVVNGSANETPPSSWGAGTSGDAFPRLPPEPPRTASLPSGANPPGDHPDDWHSTPPSEFAIPATMPPPDPWPDWAPALDPARTGPHEATRPPAGVYAAIPARRDAEALGDLDADTGRTLWQLHGRYLLSPVRSGLLIIDQQAAHERILYERALASMDSGMAPRQQLLFPFTVRLAPSDRALFDEIGPDLAALGFDLAPTKDGAVLVRGLPADVTLGDERAVLDDLLAQYRRNANLLRLDARDNLARSLARRSAIRPGHTLRPPEARALVDQLFACSDPFTDPNGRPTLVRLPEDEIERRFKR
jgi:DNA mismatch repair protein MutL